MSADNGIYILETLSFEDLSETEYRVAHLQAVENVYYDEDTGKDSTNPAAWIQNARDMWKNCKVYRTKEFAQKEAYRLYEEHTKPQKMYYGDGPDDVCEIEGYVEYGIQTISIPMIF